MIYDKDKILQEFLKDPLLREKYDIPETHLQSIKTCRDKSEYLIIELLQELIKLEEDKTISESRLSGKFYDIVGKKLK
jgi:hypothetical protein